MEILTLIISSLALLAAIADFILIIREKKRSEKRKAAMLDYADNKAIGAEKAAHREIEVFAAELQKIAGRVESLENGAVPDYQEALAAKKSVDDFNKGLSAIMGFDPMEVLRKEREAGS